MHPGVFHLQILNARIKRPTIGCGDLRKEFCLGVYIKVFQGKALPLSEEKRVILEREKAIRNIVFIMA